MEEDIEDLLHRRSDLSTFLVHFTRDSGETTAQENLLSILTNRTLEARTAFGMTTPLFRMTYPEAAKTQKVVCFTETPIEHAWMMCRNIKDREFKFNGYGLAFTKTWARRQGVNPVWYLDQTPGWGIPGGRKWLATPFNTLIDEAETAATGEDGKVDESALKLAPILRLAPFVEQMGPMKYVGRKEFWWEREWRYVGNLAFDAKEVVVVFAPQDQHDEIRQALKAKAMLRVGARLVDANWSLERIIGTLAGVSDLGPFPRNPYQD